MPDLSSMNDMVIWDHTQLLQFVYMLELVNGKKSQDLLDP